MGDMVKTVKPILYFFILTFLLSSATAISFSAFLKQNFPCTALYLSQSSWEPTYFEPTLLPPVQQAGNTSVGARSFEASLVNFTCDSPISATHIFRCNADGFSFDPATKKTKATILFLHGFIRPSEAALYVPVLSAFLSRSGSLYESVRIEAPLAPLRVTTFNNRSRTGEIASRAWIDFTRNSEDRLSLYRASQHVEKLVLSQACLSQHSTKKVLLVGHSLGAITSLEFALSTDARLAGVIPISGALPRIADYTLPPEFRPFNTRQRGYKITMIHGTEDEVVPFSAAQASAQVLESLSEVLGLEYALVPLEGLDHSEVLVQSPSFFASLNLAVTEALSS